MYWTTAFHRMSRPYRARRGSLIIECVIAAMLISVASVGLLKLTQTANQLNRQTDDRLAAVLIADNVAFRLQQIPFDQVIKGMPAVTQQTTMETGANITINLQTFTAPQADAANIHGQHFTIEVRTGISGKAVRHVWRFPNPASKELLSGRTDTARANLPRAQAIPTRHALARSASLASSRTLNGESH